MDKFSQEAMTNPTCYICHGTALFAPVVLLRPSGLSYACP